MTEPPQWMTWRAATEQALYGEHGFYRRGAGPAAHFRTSVHASPLFAQALLRLAHAGGLTTVVDVGSGRGELLRELQRLDPSLTLVGVEVAERPPGLSDQIVWEQRVPDALTDALLVANEWLDNVPVDVVVRTSEGLRVLEVEPTTGDERPGGLPTAHDAGWLDRWWPLHRVGDRAEVGRTRDVAWAAAVRRLRRGLAVAVDYGHRRSDRPRAGTLNGYAHGVAVPPVPDGTRDLTSHVALDACAAAGEAGGAEWTVLTTQRDALSALGVAAVLPDRALAVRDPPGYLAALSRAGQARELLARDGLGGFGWLVQGVGAPLPDVLQRLTRTDS
jgi:SAM-dependent MidA family methyltransferase